MQQLLVSVVLFFLMTPSAHPDNFQSALAFTSGIGLNAISPLSGERLRPGGILFGNPRVRERDKESLLERLDLRNLAYCPPPSEASGDIVSSGRTIRMQGLTPRYLAEALDIDLTNEQSVAALDGALLDLTLFSAGSDVLASRSAAAKAACRNYKTGNAPNFLVLRSASAQFAFSIVMRSSIAAQTLSNTLKNSSIGSHFDVKFDERTKTINAISTSRLFFAVSVRQRPQYSP